MEVGSRPEETGDLIYRINKRKRPHPRELMADGIGQLHCETGKRGHRAGDIAQQDDFRFGPARRSKLRLDQCPPVGEGASDGAAKVEASPLPATASLGQSGCQLPGQRSHRRLDALQLTASRMHQIYVFNEWLPQSPGHRFGPPIGNQAAHDLASDLRSQQIEQRLYIILAQAGIETIAHHAILELLPDSLQPLHHTVEVVAAAHGPSLLEAGESGDCSPDGSTQRIGVTGS